jgi:hypothetical protein
MADEAKRNGIGLLHDVSQQWGLLGKKKIKCKKVNQEKSYGIFKIMYLHLLQNT